MTLSRMLYSAIIKEEIWTKYLPVIKKVIVLPSIIGNISRLLILWIPMEVRILFQGEKGVIVNFTNRAKSVILSSNFIQYKKIVVISIRTYVKLELLWVFIFSSKWRFIVLKLYFGTEICLFSNIIDRKVQLV